jgi:hypothetical protein
MKLVILGIGVVVGLAIAVIVATVKLVKGMTPK